MSGEQQRSLRGAHRRSWSDPLLAYNRTSRELSEIVVCNLIATVCINSELGDALAAQKGFCNEFSCLVQKRVRSVDTVAFGNENRFGKFVAVVGRRVRESLDLMRRQAETQLHTQL